MKKIISLFSFTLILLLNLFGVSLANDTELKNTQTLNIHNLSKEDIKKLDPRSMVDSNGNITPYDEYIHKITPKEIEKYKNPVKGTGETIKNPIEINTKSRKIYDPSKGITSTPGEFQIERIIGPDNRNKITNTKVHPYSAISYIEISYSDGIYTCTGALIDENSILTAAHCIHQLEPTEKTAKEIYVYPGLNNNTAYYGKHKAIGWKIPVGWYYKDGDFDYAVINLATSPGNQAGAIGLRTVSSTQGQQVNVTGYAGDKAEQEGTYSQWAGLGYVKSETPYLQFYDTDTFAGQSGAPVIQSKNSVISIIGIHSGFYYGPNLNGGPKMTQSVTNFALSAAR